MPVSPEFRTQNRAARSIGILYLATMASAISASVIRMNLIDFSNPAGTMESLAANAGLFRLSIAIDLTTFAAIIGLSVGYYVLLAPVNRGFALLGLSWRLAEAAVMFTLPFSSMMVVQMLVPDPHLAGLGADLAPDMAPDIAEGLSMLLLRGYDHAFEAAMILLGLGSIVFNALLYKGRLVPRLLAGYGVISSAYLVVVILAIVVLPGQADMLRLIVFIPGTLGEISLGLWLAIRGVTPPRG